MQTIFYFLKQMAVVEVYMSKQFGLSWYLSTILIIMYWCCHREYYCTRTSTYELFLCIGDLLDIVNVSA